jgi:two-component system response regulator RegA
MPTTNKRGSVQSILIVDDDATFRARLARAFTDRGFEVRTASDATSAAALAAEESPELAVVDLRMPGQSGLELAQELLRIDPATKVVVLTGYGSIATAIEAMRLGAAHYLSKPADVDDILAAFARNGAPTLEPIGGERTTPALARAEWEHLNRVLTDCGGNISEAARRLGIHRRSLQRKLKKFPPVD